MQTENLIETEEDMSEKFGTEVTVIGMYQQLNVSHKIDDVVFVGRVYLRLKDTTTLVLEIEEKGIRSKEEIKRFENRKVKVRGVINHMTPLWGSGKESSLVSDYLSNIKKIEPVD